MTCAAFFRGLNVGGHSTVKMVELRAALTDAGFSDVRTYIQSGNAVFSCGLSERDCKAIIENTFRARFGFESAVTLRTAGALECILSEAPFSADEIEAAERANPEVEHLYVYLADEPVSENTISALCVGYAGADLLRVHGREIYLLCHESVRNSKLAAKLPKLKLPLTARNLKTIRKVSDMAKAVM